MTTQLNQNDIVIVSAARTPLGAFQGDLSSVPATELGAVAIQAVIEDSRIEERYISDVIMGNVLSAGLGQAPARQAALAAQLTHNTHCSTINKVCGSGMQAVITAHDQIKAGSSSAVVAGGMENMSLAPYFLPKARDGQRLGHGELLDHMFYDGLQNAYDDKLMGHFADENAKRDGITRKQMDQYATASLKRAKVATASGAFDAEIAPVTINSRKGRQVIETDEHPWQVKADKIPTLRPAFNPDGMVTAANASAIADGAAALLLMSAGRAHQLKLRPMAKLVAHASHSQEPALFTHAPIGAIKKLLKKTKWQLDEIDLFEVNEAFAMVALSTMAALKLRHRQTNINGGACALGHPLGATGARIIVTLLHSLKRQNKQKGIASLCIGGGEATAVAVELF